MPVNAAVYINGQNGSNGIQSSGSCTNNRDLYIGGVKYSACTGGGNTVSGEFSQVNANGGTSLKSEPEALPNQYCGSTLPLSVTLKNKDGLNSGLSGLEYQWSFVSGPSAITVSSAWSASSNITLNGLNAYGDYIFKLKVRRIVNSQTYEASGTVTVKIYQPVSPGTVNNINVCSKTNLTNTITLSGHVGTITKWQSSTSSNFTTGVVDIANTSNMLSLGANPTSTLYYRAVLTNGTCTGYSAVASVKVSSTTLSGTVWSEGLPDVSKKAIITSNLTLSSNIKACSIEVNNNAVITIPANMVFTVNDEVEVQSGNIIVESDGNLYQINENAVNTGVITVKRNAKLKLKDYNYWASPVSNQQLKSFSSGTVDSGFYTYNEPTDTFLKAMTMNNFIAGKGYAIRASASAPVSVTDPLASKDFVFKGVPNNGIISIDLARSSTGNGYNLVGNPYPSNLDLNQLYSDNAAEITGTYYFWTNINPNPAMQGANYPTAGYYNNYATYNSSGGVPPGHPKINNVEEIKKITPENIVKPGQGFIVQATGVGDKKLDFRNTQRSEKTNNKFFNRIANAKDESVDRYRIELTTPLQLVNTILVAYKEGSTLGYEGSFDADLTVESPDSFYSKLDNKKMTIQGRGYPINLNDTVELGATFYQQGVHTISLQSTEGVFANGQPIYLKDKATGQIINLQLQSYTFTVDDKSQNADRFEISYVNGTLAVDAVKNKEAINIYKDGEDFVIKANEKLKEFEIYDVSGKLIAHKILDNKEYRFAARELKPGIYVVDIVTTSQRFSKKIIK